MKRINKILHSVKLSLRKINSYGMRIVEKKPLTVFLSLLAMLFILIILGNILRKPKSEPVKQPIIKQVSTYHIGKAPRLTLQGQVEKAGVVQITALAGGVVQNISVYEGATVYRGQNLISLSSNYQGGNALSIARQIAEKQNQNVEDTYQTQKDLIAKQRDIANQTESNFEKMRDITSQSVNDTQSLIDLNNNIISSLDSNLTSLSVDPVGNASLILSTKQLKSQFTSANLQLNNSLRSAKYQTNADNPPTILAKTQKDILVKQLDVQEKALDLSRELSKLQLQVSRVNEAMMYPSAPFGAIIQRIYVRVGQAVTPGTSLFTISASQDPPLTVYVYTSKEIAEKISRLELSTLHLGSKSVDLSPAFVTTDAVQGNLYAIMYTIPQENYGDIIDKGYVAVDVPIGYPDSGTTLPYLPLDTIYQTQENALVFVVDGKRAKAKTVTLGQVYGDFVQIESGLSSNDIVILDRNIIEGDLIKE